MNNKTLMATLGAIALTVAAVPAHAQTSTPTGLSLKLGVLWPTDKAVRDATSNTWFLAGLEYRFKDMPVTTPDMKSHLSVSVDWASHSNTSVIPVLLNYVGEQQQTYWMVGAGAAFLHASGASDQTKFAYQVGFGYNFEHGPTPAFVEARYIGTSESRANGVAVDVGVRF
jgi:hypothetical protein